GEYRVCRLYADAGGGVRIQRQPQPVQRLGRPAGDAGGVRLQGPQQGIQLLSQPRRGGQLPVRFSAGDEIVVDAVQHGLQPLLQYMGTAQLVQFQQATTDAQFAGRIVQRQAVVAQLAQARQ